MALETPSRPPPFMANAILNFHFDFLKPSLSYILTNSDDAFCQHFKHFSFLMSTSCILGFHQSMGRTQYKH